jgi:hypothetical protein
MFSSADLSLAAGKILKLTCHRRLPVGYFRITGGFL